MAAVRDLAAALEQLASSYQDEQAFAAVTSFCASRWEIPGVCTVAYLALVYATRRTIPPHPFPGIVDWSFAAWNLALSLFSTWGVWQMSPAIYGAAVHEGFFFTVCGDTKSFMKYFGRRAHLLALSLFCLSKVPELGDTVFLILKRKPVRLLQWYHHATVMLFCWLALATEYTPGMWFALTNYFVHSVMYMYFFLMTFKPMARIVKPFAPFITIIQITQMVWGLVVNAVAVGSYFRTGSCQIQSITVYCAIAMYASYFWLFSQLFLESRRAAKRTGGSVARKLSRKFSPTLAGNGDASSGDEKTQKKVN